MALLVATMLALVASALVVSYMAFGVEGITFGLGFGALVGGLMFLIWWLRPRS
jgi:hypothetical protein